jgi:hypothetical protein
MTLENTFTINSTIVQKRGVILQLRTLLTDPVVNNLSLREERSDTPVENSFDRPCCEQLVPKSFGYEDVKNSLQNSENTFDIDLTLN